MPGCEVCGGRYLPIVNAGACSRCVRGLDLQVRIAKKEAARAWAAMTLDERFKHLAGEGAASLGKWWPT